MTEVHADVLGDHAQVPHHAGINAPIVLAHTLAEFLSDIAEALEHLTRDPPAKDAKPLVDRAARLRRRRPELQGLLGELPGTARGGWLGTSKSRLLNHRP